MSTKKLPKKSQQQEELMKEKRAIAEEIHHNVRVLYSDILKNPYAYYSPMVVSKLLIALKQLRHSLEELQELQMRTQEELAWLILNACKLIYDIAQPLIWNSCGKYVIETLGFAVLSMEAVINLCTIRHMNFRMKLYSSMLYCALSQGNLDQAQGTWDHCQKEIKELIEREELDPPLPDKSIQCLSECLEDLYMMKFVLDCWRDNDAISFTDAVVEKYKSLITNGSKYYRHSNDSNDLHFICRNRMIEEFSRVHLLSSGNSNETYMKRSASLAKAMQAVVIDKKGGEANDGMLSNFVIQSIFEVAYTTIIDSENMNEEVFTVYGSVLDRLAGKGLTEETETVVVSREFKEKLHIFYSLQKFIHRSEQKLDSEFIMNLKAFIDELNELLYVESSYRSKSIYIKLILTLFQKVIYQPLQKCLSEKATNNERFLKSISRPLEVMVKVLDLTFAEDPIVTSSLALLTGHVLYQIKEYRNAISLLKQALHSIEDHRAARIDFLSQLPEDVRDILALQRNAFTTKSDMNDWFHSIKRLGAHAFAGFGIFGLGSSADRSDQALAELHTDILSLYFRVELHYGYLYYRDRTMLRKEQMLRKQQEEAAKLDTAPKKAGAGSNKSKTMKKDGSSTTVVSTSGSSKKASLLPPDYKVDVNMEKLPAAQALRAYCAKNKYALTILNLEMAKLEVDGGRRLKFLEDARSFIEEVESQEEHLINGFQNLTIMTDSERKYPIVLSRSHRYIYVAPVACRKLKKAVCYKILAKEKGSGTDVSIYNNDMPGCDKVIPCEKFINNFKDIVVRIGPLRNGELYMFGCAGYAENDQVVGGVSPSSPVVEAVNPLPTILLWSYLADTCHILGYPELSMDSAIRVCNRFLMKTPIRDVVSMTNGLNLFLYEESTVCALALQQSTINLIIHFVNSFILYESLRFHKELFGKEIQWNKRQSTQLRYLTSLNKCAAVVNITTSIKNQELTIKCICLGVMLLTELMKFDEIALARYLQSSVTTFLLALQQISKRQWHDLEHKLYNKLTVQGLQLAVINCDLSPMISVFNEFYVESREKVIDELTGPSPALFSWIESTIMSMEQHLVPKHREVFVSDLKKLFFGADEQKTATESPRAGSDSIASFWKLSNVQRRLKVTGLALEMIEPPNDKSSPDRVKLEKNLLVDLPNQYSDYLAIVVQLMKDLFNRNRIELVEKLVQRMPIFLDYLNEKVQAVVTSWDVALIVSIADFIAAKQAADANAAAAGGKKAPPKKGAAAEPEVSLADQLACPERFKTVTPEEESLQMAYIAEILQMLIVANAKVPSTVNYFINSYYGPRRKIDLTHGASDLDSHSIEEKSTEETAILIDKEAARKGIVNQHTLVKYFLLAMDLLVKANKPDAAVNSVIKLWNWLIAEYLDPIIFVKEFQPTLLSIFIPALISLSDTIDKISYQRNGMLDVNPILSGFVSATNDGNVSVVNNVAVTEYVIRDCKEKMSLIVDMINFFIKSIWLLKKFPEEIVLYASRIFTLYYLNAEVDVVMKLGDATLPLIHESQETLVQRAKTDLDIAKQTLTRFVNDYEEAQQKKRKKKLRVARLEKDEEELAFEAEKARLEEIVQEKQLFLNNRQQEMQYVQHQESLFQSMIPKGQQLLQRAKKTLHGFIENIENEYGHSIDFRLLLLPTELPTKATSSQLNAMNSEVSQDGQGSQTKQQIIARMKSTNEAIENIETVYKKAIKYLRENKEKVALTEALQDLTNFLIRFGLFDHAKQYLYDTVDGLFNTMDACIHWFDVIQHAKESFDYHLVGGMTYVIMALSKLSKYYTYNDYLTKVNYARMAAACSLFYYDESIHHPKKLIGFAAYECVDLGGFEAFPIASLHEMFVALHDLVPVLLAEDHDLVALPLICLGEFLSGVYLRNARFWLDMRKYRIRVLIKQHLFAESISMLSGIKSRVQSIYEHSYADMLRKVNNSSVDSENLHTFEVSKNGLCFYDAPAFYNNQLPSTLPAEPVGTAAAATNNIENTNAKSLDWVASMASDLEAFLTTKFVVKVPESELSEEEKQKLALKRQKAQEEAAELAKKSKGKGPPPAEVNVEADLPTLSLFTSSQMIEMYLLCSQLLSEVAMLDGSNQNAKSLAEFRTKHLIGHAKSLLAKVKDMLLHKFSTSDIEEDYALRLIQASAMNGGLEGGGDDASKKKKDYIFSRMDWFELYGRMTMTENRLMIFLRHYRQSLLSINNYMKLLQHPVFNQSQLAQGGDMKYCLSYYWLQSRMMLISLAKKQANHSLVLELIQVAMKESDMIRFHYFTRKCLMIRSKTIASYPEVKKRDLKSSLQDCEKVLQMSKDYHLQDCSVVEMLVHQAYLCKEQMRYMNINLPPESSSSAAAAGFSSSTMNAKDVERGQAYHMYKQFLHILQILRESYQIGKQVMEIAGGFPVDYNITFTRAETNITGYHLLPPPLHTFTDLHNNELPLTVTATEVNDLENALLKAKNDARRLGAAYHKDPNALISRSQQPLMQSIRLGPVDNNDCTFTPSEYCNIYLKESRVLLSCQVSYLSFLDDLRGNGIDHWMKALIDQIEEDKRNGINKKAKPLIDLDEENLELLDTKNIIMEEIAIAEESLKLLRQVIFAPPAIRAKVYMYASKARIAKRIPPAIGYEAEHQQTLLGPLTTALHYIVNVQAHYLWPSIKAICVELVEVFGDDSIDLGDDQSTRLKQALQFLHLAIVANNQYRKLTQSTVELSADPYFTSAAMPEELSRILTNVFTSSMSTPLPNMHPAALAAATAAASEPVGKDAKGKAPAKGAAPAPTGGTPNYIFSGRDALYLLSSLSREVDAFSCDGDANDMSYDVHLLLKKTYPAYDNQCCINTLPTKDANINIPSTTVSTLWKLVSTPDNWFDVKKGNGGNSSGGESNSLTKESKATMDSTYGLYSHAAVFFILGDAKVPAPVAPPPKGAKVDPNAAAAGTPGSSTDPVLTKVVLYRGDVYKVEKAMRVLREQFAAMELAAAGSALSTHANYLPYAKEFGKLVYFIFIMLRHGFIPVEAEIDVGSWTDSNFSVADSVIKIQMEKVNISMPFNRKTMTTLADIFTTQRDMLQLADLEVCTFIRYALGHKTG